MSYRLPTELPPFPNQFSKQHLEALRALTRYILGVHRAPTVFPESSGLSRHDIDNFKRQISSLDFEANEKPRLQSIYQCIYQSISADLAETPHMHDAIGQLLSMIYRRRPDSDNGRDNIYDRLAALFYRAIKVNPEILPDLMEFLPGVYFLYRYGDIDGGRAEIVKAALMITAQEDVSGEGGTHLRFKLCYQRGDFLRNGNEKSMETAEGIIAPRRSNLFFVGFDYGTGGCPCLYITNRPADQLRTDMLNGVLLRKNTVDRTAAGRFVLVRTSEAADEEDNTKLQRVFNKAVGEAGLFPEDEIWDEIKDIKDGLDNEIDNETRFMLLDRPHKKPNGKRDQREH